MSNDGGPPWPAYSYLEKAAAEARQASRRYWAKGGPADKKHPQQPMPWWPEPGAVEGDDAAKERRQRRKGARE